MKRAVTFVILQGYNFKESFEKKLFSFILFILTFAGKLSSCKARVRIPRPCLEVQKAALRMVLIASSNFSVAGWLGVTLFSVTT